MCVRVVCTVCDCNTTKFRARDSKRRPCPPVGHSCSVEPRVLAWRASNQGERHAVVLLTLMQALAHLPHMLEASLAPVLPPSIDPRCTLASPYTMPNFAHSFSLFRLCVMPSDHREHHAVLPPLSPSAHLQHHAVPTPAFALRPPPLVALGRLRSVRRAGTRCKSLPCMAGTRSPGGRRRSQWCPFAPTFCTSSARRSGR